VVSGPPSKYAAVLVTDSGLRRVEHPEPRLHTLYKLTPVLPPKGAIVAIVTLHDDSSTRVCIALSSVTG
jgi:hypothetical protein